MGINRLDFRKLKQLYQFGKEIDFNDLRSLLSNLEPQKFNRKERLIQVGSADNSVFYIREGITRCYYINERGEEITFRLISENEILVNVDQILWEQPSRFHYEALEDLSVLKINYDTLQSIISKSPSIEKNRKFVFQKMMRQAHSRMESFVLLTPEERYLKYVAENKEIVNRVADKHIANVLGITPTSLSRIRKRLVQRGF